jgi:hypothetical protein
LINWHYSTIVNTYFSSPECFSSCMQRAKEGGVVQDVLEEVEGAEVDVVEDKTYRIAHYVSSIKFCRYLESPMCLPLY